MISNVNRRKICGDYGSGLPVVSKSMSEGCARQTCVNLFYRKRNESMASSDWVDFIHSVVYSDIPKRSESAAPDMITEVDGNGIAYLLVFARHVSRKLPIIWKRLDARIFPYR